MEEKWWHAFVPKTVICLREKYTWSLFRRDLFAGLTVGVVALPLALAFAIASGVGPEKGLFTAVIGGFLISLLGGSRVQIGGPAGAFVIVIYGVIQRHGYEGLIMATLLAAILLMAMGLLRLGGLIRYFPASLMRGLTTGLGMVVFSLQIRDLLGLPIEELPAGFIQKWQLFYHYGAHYSPIAFALSLGTLGIIVIVKRFFKKVPWGMVGIILATGISLALGLDVETIHARFGEIPCMLPSPSWPVLRWDMFYKIIPDAVAIALLGGVESLLSAVMGDNLTGTRHKSNCELLAQGIANLAVVVFGGIPVTGTMARTATNIHSGAATPFSGMIHALTLLLFMVFFSAFIGCMPMPALAAVLTMVAWNLAEPSLFLRGFKNSPIDVAIMLTTFLGVILANLLTGVIAGMLVWMVARLVQKYRAPVLSK